MPVLITAGLSPEAYRLQRILNIKDVVFADQSQLPQIPGTHSVILPVHSSPSFVHETLKACLDNGVTTIYPLKLGEIRELSTARALFSEYNVGLIIPSDSWLQDNPSIDGGELKNIFVLENGVLKAGSPPPANFSVIDETGIFSWATNGQKMEYSLYLV